MLCKFVTEFKDRIVTLVDQVNIHQKFTAKINKLLDENCNKEPPSQ